MGYTYVLTYIRTDTLKFDFWKSPRKSCVYFGKAPKKKTLRSSQSVWGTEPSSPYPKYSFQYNSDNLVGSEHHIYA